MPTIDYAELERMLADPDVPDSEVRPYLKAERRPGSAFDLRVVPDPAKVRMDTLDRFRVESAIRWGNGISRWRRQRRYERRIEAERGRTPVLVSEGDSWFQFPLLIDDVVDQLGRDHLIWSLDAAGDTAQNMILSRPEYLEGLRQRRADGVAAFLFSAAGNDVIGEDASGRPVLLQLLKQHQPGQGAAAHVDHARLAAILSFLEEGYRTVIRQIHAEPGFATLPILLHGYDYALPFGQPGDTRNPGWAAPDEWLAGPMRQKGIRDLDLQRTIVRLLIDALYEMLNKVAGDSRTTHVHVVDVRRTLTNVGQWEDEIHATDRGFGKVADLFRTKLREAGIVAGAS